MARIACKVPGCPGKVDVDVVDGALVESSCGYCERRAIYQREVLHETDIPCAICSGLVPRRPNGKQRKYCAACQPLAARRRWQLSNAKRRRDLLKVVA